MVIDGAVFVSHYDMPLSQQRRAVADIKKGTLAAHHAEKNTWGVSHAPKAVMVVSIPQCDGFRVGVDIEAASRRISPKVLAAMQLLTVPPTEAIALWCAKEATVKAIYSTVGRKTFAAIDWQPTPQRSGTRFVQGSDWTFDEPDWRWQLHQVAFCNHWVTLVAGTRQDCELQLCSAVPTHLDNGLLWECSWSVSAKDD